VKWIVLGGLLALIAPLTILLRSQPKFLMHACYVMGLMVFFFDPYLNIGPVTWEWTGVIKGIEITIVDIIAISILLATRPVRTPLSIRIGLGIYVLALIVSTLASELRTPAIFYMWQFCRAVVVFLAIARATVAQSGAPFALVAGIGTATIIEAIVAAQQYLSGTALNGAGGTLGHRNILGLTSHFAVMPAFALLLAGRRNLPAIAVVVAGAVIALTGGGRATIGLYGIGLVLTTILSIRHKMTGRKGALAGLALLLLILSAPAMVWAVDRRSLEDRISSDGERAAMTAAARMIIADHPLGIGPNQYVVTANLGGYSERAGVAWNFANRTAPVHNSYLLVWAESGLLGLIGLLTMLVSAVVLGLKALRRLAWDERSELMIGLLATLIVAGAHIAFEWLFMTNYVHYLLAMSAGGLVGITATLNRKSGSRVVQRRPTAETDFASQPV
jgi:O-antigen ligase